SFFGGRTCLGFKTFSIKSLAFASTSFLSESGMDLGFFAGWIIQGLRCFAIVAHPSGCSLAFASQPIVRVRGPSASPIRLLRFERLQLLREQRHQLLRSNFDLLVALYP